MRQNRIRWFLILLVGILGVSWFGNITVEAAGEVYLKRTIDLDPRISLSNLVDVQDHIVYIPKLQRSADRIEIYLMSLLNKEVTGVVTSHTNSRQYPPIFVFKEELVYIDYQTYSVVFLDQKGNRTRSIEVENTCGNSYPGNDMYVVLQGQAMYLNNHFVEEEVYLIQKYSLDGKLLAGTNQVRVNKLIGYGEYLFAFYFDTVIKLDFDLKIVEEYKFNQGNFDVNSRYIIHQDYMIALDGQLKMHILNFQGEDRVVSLSELVEIEQNNVVHLLLYNNGETFLIIDQEMNRVYEFGVH